MSPGTTTGTQTVTLIDQRGPLHPGRLVLLHDPIGQPVESQRRPGYRRQRAGRRVLRVLPVREQRPRRQFRRPAHRDPPHHLRPLDGDRPGDSGQPAGDARGQRLRPHDGQPEQVPPRSARRRADREAARQAVKRVQHSEQAVSHPIQQVGGPLVATTSSATGSQPTAIGALGTLDQALDQIGTPGKQRKS